MKKTIIFLHGGPGFKDYLGKYFSVLEESFTCIFYDQLRGSSVKIDDLLSELGEVVNNQDGDVILLGHSWGGVLATAYTAKNTNKVSALVLMSTGLNTKHWYDIYYNKLDELDLNESPMEDIFLSKNEVELGKSLLKFGNETFCEDTFDSLDDSFLRKYDLTHEFSNFDIPIFNIYGEEDLRFSAEVHSEIKELNKNVIEFPVKETGHFPFLQKQNLIMINEFLKDSLLDN